MRAYKWNYHHPGLCYAETYEFRRPVTEQEARAYIRDQYGYNRLPAGTCLWPYAPVRVNSNVHSAALGW